LAVSAVRYSDFVAAMESESANWRVKIEVPAAAAEAEMIPRKT